MTDEYVCGRFCQQCKFIYCKEHFINCFNINDQIICNIVDEYEYIEYMYNDEYHMICEKCSSNSYLCIICNKEYCKFCCISINYNNNEIIYLCKKCWKSIDNIIFENNIINIDYTI